MVKNRSLLYLIGNREYYIKNVIVSLEKNGEKQVTTLF